MSSESALLSLLACKHIWEPQKADSIGSMEVSIAEERAPLEGNSLRGKIRLGANGWIQEEPLLFWKRGILIKLRCLPLDIFFFNFLTQFEV